jgi:hypothetical protein
MNEGAVANIHDAGVPSQDVLKQAGIEYERSFDKPTS